MKRLSIGAATMVAAFGLSFAAFAGPSAEQQTSAEQVQACQDGIQQCQGGDQLSCVAAIKVCVGEDRQTAMKLIQGA